jgi:hypothetical protein
LAAYQNSSRGRRGRVYHSAGKSARFSTRPFPAARSREQLRGSIGALPGHWRIKMAALAARFRVFADGGPGSVKRAGEFGVDKIGGGWAANLVCFVPSGWL